MAINKKRKTMTEASVSVCPLLATALNRMKQTKECDR